MRRVSELTKSKPDPIITVGEVANYGMCAWGIVRWLKSNGFDVKDAVRNGVPASRLKSLDARVDEIIERKINGRQ